MKESGLLFSLQRVTWGRKKKLRYDAGGHPQRKIGFHDCLSEMIIMNFVGGLHPNIRQIVESQFANDDDVTGDMLLEAAKAAELSVASGPSDGARIMEMEAELAAFRLSGGQPSRGGFQHRGRATTRGGPGSSAPKFQQQQQQQAAGGGGSASGSGLSHKEKIQIW